MNRPLLFIALMGITVAHTRADSTRDQPAQRAESASAVARVVPNPPRSRETPDDAINTAEPNRRVGDNAPHLGESSRSELASAASQNPAIGAPAATRDTVVLLHGLGLNRFAMLRMACALKREGYRVVNLSYPSRRVPLEQLASAWLPAALRPHHVDTATRVHFVTHSMGGIVLRLWLREPAAREARVGRIVMLAPPNRGSEVADRLRAFPPFRLFTGINGPRLGTDAASVPRQLGATAEADEIGIIAGNRSLNPLFSAWLPGPDDGKVAVASTRLDGMRDFVVVPRSHTWLPWSSQPIRQVKTFLRHGTFAQPRPSEITPGGPRP
jgi:triacylglycerol lipase